MGLPPGTRIEDDRETLAPHGRTGGLPIRRAAALAALILAVAAAGLYGQHMTSGPQAAASPTGSRAGSYQASASPVSTVAVPTPLVITVPATPVPTQDTGGLPQVQPPLYSLRASLIGSRTFAVSGTRFYQVLGPGMMVTDTSSDPSPSWYQVPVACKSTDATLAAAGDSVIYAYTLPQPGGSDCVASNVWHLMLVDASSGFARAAKHADLGNITDAGSAPMVAISSDVYAFAYQQTASNTIVEVHALSNEKLLWSATLPGQLQSLAAGGSRILLSVLVASSATQHGAYSAMQNLWMDPTHHEPQSLGVAWGTPSLSLDGSTAAWFDASQPNCHVLFVEDLTSGSRSYLHALSDQSAARACAVAVDVVDAVDGRQTTVAWTPIDTSAASFLALWQSDGTSEALIGLPAMSWISLQGRTLAAVAERGREAITIDLDMLETALP